MSNLASHPISPASSHVAGQPIRYARREDHRLITGAGRFAADHLAPDMLHAYVIRSTHAHAWIRRCDLSAVASASGVRLVLTAADIEVDGPKELPNLMAVTSPDGAPQRVVLMPVLARDRVHFLGQPIAFVVADTADAAQDAAELALIDYEELAAVASFDEAIAPGAIALHPGVPGNLSVHYEAGDRAAVDAAFARATYVSRLKINSQRLIGAPMEPRAVLAVHDRNADRTRLFAPTQGVPSMTKQMCAATGLAPQQLDIVSQDVGGSFGLRASPYSEHVLAVLAARKLNQPVRWLGSRSEIFLSDWHGRALTLDGQIALDAEGRILALRFEDTVDLGAYIVFAGTLVGTRNLSVSMGGVYRVPALHMSSRLAYTNTVPVSAYRGAGRPDIAYAIEALMDHASREHGFDRIALRRLNFITPEAFPYRTANGTVYDHCNFERLLARALELSEFDSFPARRAAAQAQGRLRGIGLASWLEVSGMGSAPHDSVRGEFDDTGNLIIFGATGASGQGHETSFATMVEEALGLPADRVMYRAGDHGVSVVGNGTEGSRTLYGAGSAITVMCEQIRERVNGLRAARGESPDASFDLSAWVRSLSAAERSQLAIEAQAKSGATFPNGCHVAEIEIDPSTGTTQLIRYVSVDDAGRLISEQLVHGQMQGGVVQGWGQAFCENVVYDARGQLSSGSFMDYAMPKAGCVPELVSDNLPIPTTLNRTGAKGVGESGCTGSLPALANAMSDALAANGAAAIDMPFTPARVWAALNPETR
ncbi:MAG: xanthine dehydrogenase family protein molybdopterin-binding subunit [Betaproteobacteria bacterium]